MLNGKKMTGLLGVLILALIIVACGGAADTPTTAPSAPESTPIPEESSDPGMEEGMLPEINPLEVSGDIVSAGS